MRLWRNNPETPEGKYPIALRRDGTPIERRYMVIVLRDPAASAAFAAYALEAARLGYDAQYVADVVELSRQAAVEASDDPGDPMAPRHRVDDPVVLAWARSIMSLLSFYFMKWGCTA